MAQFPNLIDLTEPNDADTLANSNGKSAGQIVRESNAEIEAIGGVLAGPVFKNPKAATAAPAVTLANCTSLTADGPRSPAAVWTGYGEYNTPAPVRTIGTVSGETYVNAVFTGPSGGWLVCNLGSDYPLAGYVALKMELWPSRNAPDTNRTIHDNIDIIVSDAAITGVNATNPAVITAGTTVTSPPNGSLPDGTFSRQIHVPLGSLTKIRAFAFHLHDISYWAWVALRVRGVALRAATELEAALSTGATLVPETYAPSGTQDQLLPLGHSGHAGLDLRSDYRIIYGYGGEHHVREAQIAGVEDGSVVADNILRATIESLKPGDKLVFPPNAQYRVQSGIWIRGKHDIEIDCNGATFYKDAVGAQVASPLFAITGCSRLKIHGFKYFGYHENLREGVEWTPITGTAVVGTTRTFSAQNHAAYAYPGGQWGMRWLARDKDGYYTAEFTLSDTNQVAQDCRVSLQTEGGTTLGARAFTLTSTPTAYTIKIRDRSGVLLHKKMKWHVSKQTATANTITLTSAKLLGTSPGPGGGVPWEQQQAIVINGESDDIEIYDWHSEGCTSYAFHVDALRGWGRNIHFHDFSVRASSCQGIGIVGCNGPITVEHFSITETNGNAIDVEPNGLADGAHDITIRHGYIRNCSLGALTTAAWGHIKNLVIDDITIVDAQTVGGYGLGAVGGSISNIRASLTYPATDFFFEDGTPIWDLDMLGVNMTWSNIHLSRGWRMNVHGAGTYYHHDETNILENGVSRTFEAGGNVVSDIFVDGGTASVDQTNDVYDGGTFATPVITEQGGGSNIIRNVTHNAQAPLVFDPVTTANFAVLPGTPEFHGLESRPWQRAAPNVFRAASIGTPEFSPGGVQAFSQPLFDVQSLSGAVATPTVFFPSALIPHATVSGTPNVVLGSAFPVAPDGVVEVNFEATAPGATKSWGTQVGSGYVGVRCYIQGSVDGTNWHTIHGLPNLRLPGYRRGRVFTGSFTSVRMYIENWSVGADATVAVIGSWTGSRGNNLRMLDVPVTAGATTRAVIFPNKPVPPTKPWTATSLTTGGTLTAGTWSYRVGLRGGRTGPGVPDAARTAAVSGSTGSVKLTADVGVPDPATGWYASAYTIFRKNPADANYLWRSDVIPFAPLANYHPGGSILAWWLDNGTYVGLSVQPGGYGGGYPWVAIGGGGYSTAQLNTHDESGWEPDTNYGVQVNPSWLTTVAVTAKRVDGLDLAFGTAAPGGGGTVDLFFVR